MKSLRILAAGVVAGLLTFAISASPAGAAEKAAAKEKSAAKIVGKDKLPQVLFKTTKGDVLMELYEDQAPNTVANFVSLVEKGFYDGLTFHRVIDQFMAQGGCPQGTGTGGPGYYVKCECYRKDHKKHARGVLSMAHAGRNTGGSQFYITFIKTSWLDGKHTVFGRVVKGMDVVDKFQKTSDQRGRPVPGSATKVEKIIKATVVQKRDHPYKPETIKK